MYIEQRRSPMKPKETTSEDINFRRQEEKDMDKKNFLKLEVEPIEYYVIQRKSLRLLN